MDVVLTDAPRMEVLVSQSSDWTLFDQVASALEHGLAGHWVEQTDGIDQRYWDLRTGDALLALHLEHYLGIVAFPALQNEVSYALVRRAAALLADWVSPDA